MACIVKWYSNGWMVWSLHCYTSGGDLATLEGLQILLLLLMCSFGSRGLSWVFEQ